MKKILLTLSLVLSFALVGCSSNSEYKDVSVDSIKEAVVSSGLLVEDTLPDAPTLDQFEYFNDIKDDITEGFISRAALILRLEDVIVIKTDNPDSVYTALEGYKVNMIDMAFGGGYGAPENADIAANTILEKKGNSVYLVAAKNATEIEKIIVDTISN